MIRFIIAIFMFFIFAAVGHAAPGDKIIAGATAFTNITGAGGKAKATMAKDTLKVQGGGATTVTVTPGTKTVTVSTPAQVQSDWFATTGLAQILNKPAETCAGRLSWDGIDGTQIYFGTGTPADGTGVTKDLYIDSATYNFYRKEGTPAAWTQKGNLVGPANSLAIGTISTVPYTQPASCTITGTPPNQTLSCALTQGVPGDPGNLTRANITEKLLLASDVIVYLQPATNSATAGGLVINDYAGNAAVVIRNGAIELRDTSGNNVAKIDRSGGIYGYKSGGAPGMSWTPTGGLVLY